jgi:PAS domain S-box-containing protein
MKNLQYYINELKKIHTKKCLVITDNQLEKPHPIILWANKEMEKLTGYTLEELKANSPRVLQGPDTDRKTLDRLRATLERGAIFEGGIVNYRKNGTKFYKAWRIAPIKDDDGKVLYYFAVHKETTPEECQKALQKIAKLQNDVLARLGSRHQVTLKTELPRISGPP